VVAFALDAARDNYMLLLQNYAKLNKYGGQEILHARMRFPTTSISRSSNNPAMRIYSNS